MLKALAVTAVILLSPVLVYIGYHNIGYNEVPHPVPVAHELLDARLQNADAQAIAILRSARETLAVPSLSAAVALHGKLIWWGATGWQDIEAKIPATNRTRYRIGSTSKALTATIAARMVDRQLLDVDEPLSRYQPQLPNPAWSSLTSRQLMSHTAGLPGYEENRDYWGLYQTLTLRRSFQTVAGTLEVFDDTPLLFEPGTSFHYSSFDVNLMSFVLEGVAQRDFPDLVSEEIGQVLGLRHTDVDRAGVEDTSEAQFYEMNRWGVKPWRRIDLSLKWAGGGLISTPSDLVLIGSSWLNTEYLSSSVRAQFWTPQKLANGDINEQNYAMGWRVDETVVDGRTLRRAHHGGVSKGSMNWLVVYPDAGLVIDLAMNARVSNFSDFAQFEKELASVFLAEAQAP